MSIRDELEQQIAATKARLVTEQAQLAQHLADANSAFQQRDGQLAAAEAARVALDAAEAAAAGFDATGEAANSRVGTSTAEVQATQEALRVLEAQLAGLPPDPPPPPPPPPPSGTYRASDRVHLNPRDGFGLRVEGPNSQERFAKFRAVTGLEPRWACIFEAPNPCVAGRWEKLKAAIAEIPNARWVVAWRPLQFDRPPTASDPDGGNTRGSNPPPTVAEIRGDIARLRAIVTNRTADAGVRKAMRGLIATVPDGKWDQVELRGPGHEHIGTWYTHGYLVTDRGEIDDTEAVALSNELADASREAIEHIWGVMAAELGPDRWSKITLRYNLAGTLSHPRAVALVLRAFPRQVAPNTHVNLSTDDYIAFKSDVENFRKNIANLETLADQLPNVVAIGIDETGGHAKTTDGANRAGNTELAEYGRLMVATTKRWAREGRNGGIMFFETSSPNNRDALSTKVFFEETEIQLPTAGPVRGADGVTYRSQYPGFAKAIIEGMAA